jgi:hypothetical protein
MSISVPHVTLQSTERTGDGIKLALMRSSLASHLIRSIRMLPPGGAVLPFIIVLAIASSGNALDSHSPGLYNRDAQGVNFWKLSKQQQHATQSWTGVSQIPLAAVASATAAVPEFRPETFTQPLDHFYNSTNATFPQRFWVNSRHYEPRPGAPVIVIDGGETNGEDRLPFLDTGIADILARATGGVGVVLEHRYYGAFSLRVCMH